MEMSPLHCLIMLLAMFAVVHLVHAQSQKGFISLDCGLMPDESPYDDLTSGLTFISDAGFVETGESRRIQKELEGDILKPYLSLRSFPEGKRNCYNLNVTEGTNYMIKATFVYGNYDDKSKYPSFDLHLGPNKWTTVDMEGREKGLVVETLHLTRSGRLQICLVKTGATIPFISALELRPLNNQTYTPQSGSLLTFFRRHITASTEHVWFDDDVHDRLWAPFIRNNWTQISTNRTVDTSSNVYELPQAVMRTAGRPTNAGEPLTMSWKLDEPSTQMYLYMHFAEIEELKANETREFSIVLNGEVIYGPFSPPKLEGYTVYDKIPKRCESGECIWQLVKSPRSTHPPLLNAIEVFTGIEFPHSETEQNDVDAMQSIKAAYGLSRISWQGDPCLPEEYSWEGLNCNTKDRFDRPRITSLNLSSSGLSGFIAPFIQNLTELEELDLSNNSLIGGVPEFLANMRSLRTINLNGNNLNGSVPQALIDREKDGLQLNVQGNRDIQCLFDSCENQDKRSKTNSTKFLVPLVASLASFIGIALALVAFYVFRRRKSTSSGAPTLPSSSTTAAVDFKSNKPFEPSITTTEMRFTYSDVLRITNNFQEILGRGGFGVVYHGYLNGVGQVAIKMLSKFSEQGYKQFKAEIELLLRVHHKNLVSLAGYCDEGDNVALIYEHMENRDLREHLSGKRSGHLLSWASRLKIAIEAAQGLEYLHNGCKPPMAHRDVKTKNILLDKHFQAKLSDFGLSRPLPIEGGTYVSTVIAGTPGYLDPEYHRSYILTSKSDVYSFGVVLLEIITNQAVIDKARGKPHIIEWVESMLAEGNLNTITDPKLLEDYDNNSVWKAIELAMSCVNPSSARRPNMAYVVTELKQCLAAENSRTGRNGEMESTRSLELSTTYAAESS